MLTNLSEMLAPFTDDQRAEVQKMLTRKGLVLSFVGRKMSLYYPGGELYREYRTRAEQVHELLKSGSVTQQQLVEELGEREADGDGVIAAISGDRLSIAFFVPTMIAITILGPHGVPCPIENDR